LELFRSATIEIIFGNDVFIWIWKVFLHIHIPLKSISLQKLLSLILNQSQSIPFLPHEKRV